MIDCHSSLPHHLFLTIAERIGYVPPDGPQNDCFLAITPLKQESLEPGSAARTPPEPNSYIREEQGEISRRSEKKAGKSPHSWLAPPLRDETRVHIHFLI